MFRLWPVAAQPPLLETFYVQIVPRRIQSEYMSVFYVILKNVSLRRRRRSAQWCKESGQSPKETTTLRLLKTFPGTAREEASMTMWIYHTGYWFIQVSAMPKNFSFTSMSRGSCFWVEKTVTSRVNH